MKRMSLLAAVVSVLCAAAVLAQSRGPASSPASKPASNPAPASTVPASSSPATATSAPALSPAKQAAQEWYDKILAAYMKGDLSSPTGMTVLMKESAKQQPQLTGTQRSDLGYMNQAIREYRPEWWGNTKKNSNISFQARIWSRQVMANFVPSEDLGLTSPVGEKDGRLIIIVSWKPSVVDSPKPAGGYLCKRFGMTESAFGDAIVWHELGHNFISSALALKDVMDLYDNHWMVFDHCQEFYADMTALYHACPHGRLASLFIRIDEMERNRETESHCRASLGIGSLILANVLADPQKWPSFHLPAKVPDKDIERKTIIYLYDHIDAGWSLAEDRAFRDMVNKFILNRGDDVLKKGGEVLLPNKLVFRLMVSEDRDNQAKRDAWVKEQLEKAIKSGRADPEGAVDLLPRRDDRIDIPW